MVALPHNGLSNVIQGEKIDRPNQIDQMREDYYSHNYIHMHTTFVVHPLHVTIPYEYPLYYGLKILHQ